jgi:CRISPR-associated endonuclease/helicase Cas3
LFCASETILAHTGNNISPLFSNEELLSYVEFFRRLCGSREPFPYQIDYHETRADFRVLKAPTGLGKTDAVIVDWLSRKPTTRLIYCLPGRALTKQVAEVAQSRVHCAGLENEVRVLELMGGSEDLGQRIGPQDHAILVGTQDILISRALNRGYAQSPFRWPVDFALLNNDATWIFDEIQLLGDALATSTQLAALRKHFRTFGNVPCVWMSATLEEGWLKTVDFQESPTVIGLGEKDLQIQTVRQRVNAVKSVQATDQCDLPRDCANFVIEQHRPGTLTLVIANTVARAQDIWDELRRNGAGDALLLHSRFRPSDRTEIIDRALKQKNGIVVSTQVIEAGVDIDADLMVTDVAPWSSLVQRFGRVNRYGDRSDSRIYWAQNPQRSKGKAKTDKQFAPYEAAEVEQADAVLKQLNSAAPKELAGKAMQPAPYKFVLRRSDLIDLFDTTPDLTGNHIDVSRFVRSGEETNVYVAWREWPGPERQIPENQRLSPEELCPVPRGLELDAFLKDQIAWTWEFTGRGRWERVDRRQLYPGMRILLRSESGGYDIQRGWTPHLKARVPPVARTDERAEDAIESDPYSEGIAQELRQHSDEVVTELAGILEQIPANLNGYRESLTTAARYHDWGKAHPVFQQTLHNLEEPPTVAPDRILAKQIRELSRKAGHSRAWFRHELASALALLQAGEELAAYIVAAHHGKVRLNIRSMPGEIDWKHPESRIARGIEEGDRLFAANLGGGVQTSEVVLTLTATELGVSEGARGWSDRVLDLLKDHGPFQLSYLEMLLRVADERASAKAKGDPK